MLPAAAAQERTGSFTTWEGRRQAFAQVVPPPLRCMEDWDILRQVARAMGTDLGWETAMDVRREAAPLMAAERSVADRLATVRSGERGEAPTHDDGDLSGEGERSEPAGGDLSGEGERSEPAGGDLSGEGERSEPAGGDLIVEAVPALLGRGSMLRGADALNATARPPQAWVHPADAERAGIAAGDRVALTWGDARIELPVRTTTDVAEGCVRVPRNSLETPLGTLVDPEAAADAPLRVRLQSLAGADT